MDAGGPLILGLENDIAVRHILRHRIGRNLSGAGLGKHQLDFGQFFHGGLDLSLHSERLFEVDRGNAGRGEGNILLVELRDELAAQQSERRHRGEKEGQSAEDERPRPCDRLVEQRQIALLALADQPHFLLGDPAANEQRHHGRHEGQRQDEGRDQREHDRDCHRRERLALDAGEHEQRRKGKQDDCLPENGRLYHFLSGAHGLLKPLAKGEQPALMFLPVR
ncbi:hypothetical protein D9M73_125770 [compost metagenome]